MSEFIISIIVPCFNEEEALPLFYKEFLLLAIEIKEHNFELILVDDGSCDNTFKVMKQLAEADNRVKYLSFSRNFGKEAAIYAGLEYSCGSYVAIMDADLQDPPELLPQMLHAVINEGYDSVATRRVTRQGEPPIRSFFARQFYKIMSKISKTEFVDGARDYRLMNRKFVNAILAMKEYNRFSKGLFGWIGFKTKWIEYENIERIVGETKWSFWKLMIYAIDGITAFSTFPLAISVISGASIATLSFLFILLIVIRRLMFGDPVAGWASTICIILFLGGLQMLFIGILGQYIAKTYLEVKDRPIYICSESNMKKGTGDE